MNTADPIRDRQKIRQIKEELRATNSKDYLLLTMGGRYDVRTFFEEEMEIPVYDIQLQQQVRAH